MHRRPKNKNDRRINVDMRSALFGAGIMALIFTSAFMLSIFTLTTEKDVNIIKECVESDPLEDMNYDPIEQHQRLYLGTEV